MADEEVSTQIQFPACQRAYTNTQPILNEWTNHSAFYCLYPSYYFPYAQNWVRPWLQWFDGYVQGIHDGEGGIISTRLATTLCYRLAEQVFGGGLLFSISNKMEDSEQALKFLSGKFKDDVDLDGQVLKTFVLTSAGGTAYLKTNVGADHEIWLDSWRADQCYVDIDFKGKVSRAKFIVAKYTKTVPQKRDDKNYFLMEERFYATKKDNAEYKREFKDKIYSFSLPQELEVGKPYVRYTIHRLEGQVTNQWVDIGRGIGWAEVPEDVKKAVIDAYGIINMNVPQRLPFVDLGVDAFKWTSFISNLPQLPYGESLIERIKGYLFEYDFMNSCMNTDFYLARGRVLVPKSLQNPQARNGGGNWNSGLDNFLFTKLDYSSVEDKKPEAVQFDIRSQEWVNSRNNLLESMATAIGISPSTIASYLQDSSARTAREISSEESATALFVENRRKLFTKPINDMIKRVLLYYGYNDTITVKFSKSGQTNTTLVTENTVTAVNNKLMSQYQGVKNINPDMSEEEIQQEIERINAEQEKLAKQNEMFGGGFDDNAGGFVGGGSPMEAVDEPKDRDSEEAEP